MGSVHTPTPPTRATDAMAITDPTQRRFRGSAKLSDYTLLQEKLGEGTFGVVSKARSKRTGAIVALKKILMHNEKEGFPITALREVKLLKMLSHPNVLRLEEMAVERAEPASGGGDGAAKSKGGGTAGKKRATLYMVMPYMDHDLSGMLTNPDIRFSEGQIKCYMQQLLEGLRYLHDSHILHRDMKAANLLISNKGILQIADFGLARHYEGQTPVEGGGNGVAVRDYTSLVVTRWYRPPELLLTLKRYTPAIDLWGVGCVFGEMFERKPILEGKSDLDQCHRIFQLVGSPTDQSMPGWSDLPGCDGTKDFETQKGDIDKRFGPRIGKNGLSLLKSLLCLDWRKRINAIDALHHEYFKTEPLPTPSEDLPKYEDSHELDSRRRGHEKQRALPPAPAGGTVGMGPDEWNGSGPPPYGYGGDRAPRRGVGERGPPVGGNYRYHDDRPAGRGPQLPSSDVRPPAWRQDRDRDRGGPRGGAPPNLGPNSQPLPPRPADLPARPDLPRGGPPSNSTVGSGRDRDRDRDRIPPAPPAGGNVDTYIPSYSAANPNDRPRRGSRENAYRDPDAPPPAHPQYGGGGRGAYRDPDAPAARPPTREREGYRERGAYEGQRGTRSRSPSERSGHRERERDWDGGREREDERRYRDHRPSNRDRDRDWERDRDRDRGDMARRERLQNRERDFYGR